MIYRGSYYHIYSKGFLTPLYSGGTVLVQKQLLIDLLSFSVESVCGTLPGKQPEEKCSSCLRTLIVLMVVDVHLCLIFAKNTHSASVLKFLDWCREGGESLFHIVLSLQTK